MRYANGYGLWAMGYGLWAMGIEHTSPRLRTAIIAGDQVLPHSGGAWLTLIVLGLNTVVCHSLVVYALKWRSSELMSTILLLSRVLTAVVAWALFWEALSLLNLLGFVVILVGIYLAISDEGELKIPED